MLPRLRVEEIRAEIVVYQLQQTLRGVRFDGALPVRIALQRCEYTDVQFDPVDVRAALERARIAVTQCAYVAKRNAAVEQISFKRLYCAQSGPSLI